jgi:hypothetical protein
MKQHGQVLLIREPCLAGELDQLADLSPPRSPEPIKFVLEDRIDRETPGGSTPKVIVPTNC